MLTAWQGDSRAASERGAQAEMASSPLLISGLKQNGMLPEMSSEPQRITT